MLEKNESRFLLKRVVTHYFCLGFYCRVPESRSRDRAPLSAHGTKARIPCMLTMHAYLHGLFSHYFSHSP